MNRRITSHKTNQHDSEPMTRGKAEEKSILQSGAAVGFIGLIAIAALVVSIVSIARAPETSGSPSLMNAMEFKDGSFCLKPDTSGSTNQYSRNA